jgi:PilJ/NarX-like methyl-accepting chemotaxis transducer
MLNRLLVLFSGLCLFAAVHAAEPVDAEVADLAGEQRMLSQRLVKAYAQLGLGVVPTVASAQITDATLRFDANLVQLRRTIDRDAGPAVDRLAARWEVLKTAAADPPSRDSATLLSQHSLAVLDAAAGVTAAGGRAAADSGSVVGLAGQQRTLSQRVAKAYMLLSWGGPSASLRDELRAAAAEFSENLVALAARAENNDATRLELDELALQWEWLSTALAAEGAVSYRLVVAEAADSILASADRLTHLYQKLSGSATKADRSEK